MLVVGLVFLDVKNGKLDPTLEMICVSMLRNYSLNDTTLWVYGRVDPTPASGSQPYSPWVYNAGPRMVLVDRSVCIHADDMRRIVASHNACIGISTEELEQTNVLSAAVVEMILNDADSLEEARRRIGSLVE